MRSCGPSLKPLSHDVTVVVRPKETQNLIMIFTRGGAAKFSGATSRDGRDQNSWTRDHIKWRHQDIYMVSYEKRAFFSIDRPPDT
jgi:hypothetical protein